MIAILEKEGYRVRAAADAAQALQFVAEGPGRIDLLLTDVVMPGMNGRELAARLTSRDPALKVLFMSGFAAEVFQPGSSREPAVEFIQKPMTGEALANKIRQVFDTRLSPV
jgi:two-component system cell cycle sensor histidine kinase/response regulator CckA